MKLCIYSDEVTQRHIIKNFMPKYHSNQRWLFPMMHHFVRSDTWLVHFFKNTLSTIQKMLLERLNWKSTPLAIIYDAISKIYRCTPSRWNELAWLAASSVAVAILVFYFASDLVTFGTHGHGIAFHRTLQHARHRFPPGGKQSVSRAIDDSPPVAISCRPTMLMRRNAERVALETPFSSSSSSSSRTCAIKREKLVCTIDSHAGVPRCRYLIRFRVHFAADSKKNKSPPYGKWPGPWHSSPAGGEISTLSRDDEISNVGGKQNEKRVGSSAKRRASVTKFIRRVASEIIVSLQPPIARSR